MTAWSQLLTIGKGQKERTRMEEKGNPLGRVFTTSPLSVIQILGQFILEMGQTFINQYDLHLSFLPLIM